MAVSLAALVEHLLQENPLSGQLFVFRNKRADRIKLLHWDATGYALWYKRLERGTFRFPTVAEGTARINIAPSDFLMLLDGVELSSVKRQKRFLKWTPGARKLEARIASAFFSREKRPARPLRTISRSRCINPAQLTLFTPDELESLANEMASPLVDHPTISDAEVIEADAKSSTKRCKLGHGRRVFPEHLSREQRLHELTGNELKCQNWTPFLRQVAS